MADAHAKHHDYHLVDPSPWPVVGSVVGLHASRSAPITWMHHSFAAAPLVFGARRDRRALHHARLVARRHQRGRVPGRPHPRGADLPPLRHDPVHRLRGDVLRRLVLGLFQHRAVSRPTCIRSRATAFIGGVWPPKGIETFDPWHLPLLNTLILLTSGTTVTWAHHALLRERPRGPQVGPDLHHRARRSLHLRAGLRIQPRRLRLQGQHLRRDLLHGDRLPRLPRHHRHRSS